MAQKKPFQLEAPEQFTIFVETLTGTTFEVKVSPQDIVRSVKSKIQRVEGIPVSHQHLLYNLKELNDSSCITEPSVGLHDGATVKLVLSMRGGPISLVHQAVPLNRAVLRNLLQINREDLHQDLPPGCKMAIIVRVGDQLNFLHVVEDTESPTDILLEDEVPIRLEENSRTMEKVCDLRGRMEKLSLQRKQANHKRGDSSSNPSCSFNPVCSMDTKKLNNKVRLPSINNDSRRDTFKSRSDFSQIPILPDIVPKTLKNTSRDLEFSQLDDETPPETEDTLRPKTSPGSLPESRFYDVCSGVGITQAIPYQYRSCVSAGNPKLYHEWRDQKDVIPSLDILPPISNLLTSRSTFGTIHRQKITSSPVKEPLGLTIRKESKFIKYFNKNELSKGTMMESEKHPGSSHRESWISDSPYHSPETASAVPPQFSSPPYVEIVKSKEKNNLVQVVNKKITTDKNTRPRCSECRKKLSLTTTFECRCGFAFCSFHRYSETHNCAYDFKKDSRKILEQANPSVIAPKLPKI